MIPQPSVAEQRALVSSLARVRLRRFRSAVGGSDRIAIQMYLLDAQIASHLHATVRMVEIALREHIHRALATTYGDRWFQTHRGMFDTTTHDRLDEALGDVGQRASAGKVVAQLMLGTWVRLLGRGDRKPDGTKARYNRDLWEPAIGPTLPGRTRGEVHKVALRLNWARNRINHCEPVVFGFPQPGTGQEGVQVRLAPHLILKDARDLIGMLDGDLGSWLRRWNQIDELLDDELLTAALDHVETDPAVQLER